MTTRIEPCQSYVWLRPRIKSEMNVSDTEDGYQPPLLPTKRKDEMFTTSKMQNADDRTSLVVIKDTTSYHSLVTELLQADSSDTEKVRTLYSWLGHQDMENMDYTKVTDSTTPMGYMMLIKSNRGSYACFFALLCRAAHIPSVIIHGKIKGIGYEPGCDDVSSLHSSWNAVYVEGSWRFVHTSCAFRTILGFSSGYWTPIESHANLSFSLQPRIKWSFHNRSENFFLFPDPSDFIYLCFPDSQDWQLLKQPWTLEQFLGAPHLRETFFTLNLIADGINSCDIQPQSGVASLTIRCKDKVCPNLFGTLYFDNMWSHNNIPEIASGYKFIDVLPKDFATLIMIDIPIQGIFKLEIYGGKDSTTLHPVAEFRIKNINNDADNYTIDEMTSRSSVANTTTVEKHKNGPGRFTYTFNKLPLDPHVGCKTKRAVGDSGRGTLVNGSVDSGRVATPHTMVRSAKTSGVNSASLVIQLRTKRIVKTALERGRNSSDVVVTESAKLARLTAQIKDLEITVRKCETARLKHCDDLTEARTLLVKWNKEVDALKDLQRLRHNIKPHTTHNSEEVAVQVHRELREKLARYKEKDKHCSALESSLSEDLRHINDNKQPSVKVVRVIKYPLVKILKHLHRVNNPVCKIVQLMKALLMLLGYIEKDLKGWMYIQTILRNTDVLKQMENLKISDILQDTVVKVKTIMESITRESIFNSNRELPELYDWVKWVLEEVDKG